MAEKKEPWADAYEDEVAAAEAGVLFQPGCVPQKGKKLANVIDLDPPGSGHWLAGARPEAEVEEE